MHQTMKRFINVVSERNELMAIAYSSEDEGRPYLESRAHADLVVSGVYAVWANFREFIPRDLVDCLFISSPRGLIHYPSDAGTIEWLSHRLTEIDIDHVFTLTSNMDGDLGMEQIIMFNEADAVAGTLIIEEYSAEWEAWVKTR